MSYNWTEEDVAALAQKRRQPPQVPAGTTIGKPSKHRSRKCVLDGLTFDSEKEGRRYQELKLLEHVGAIRGLVCQPKFDLFAPNGERIAIYRADFLYWSLELGRIVIEDVKSAWTRRLPVYRIKAKWMAAQGTPITEV